MRRSNNNNNNNANNDSNTTILKLEDIQHGLEELEQNLQNQQGPGILFTDTDTDNDADGNTTSNRNSDGDERVVRDSTNNCSTAGAATVGSGGGRTIFDSIDSALSNIRGRLQALVTRSSSNHRSISSSSPSLSPSSSFSLTSNINTPAPVAQTTIRTSNNHDETNTTTTTVTFTKYIQLLLERLSLAEQSHSTHIPLTLLQLQFELVSSSRREEIIIIRRIMQVSIIVIQVQVIHQ